MCQRANTSSGHFQASRLISAALIVAGKQVGCITLNTRFRRFKTSIIHSPDQNAELLSSLSMRICAALQSPHSWLRQIIAAPKPLLPEGLGNFFVRACGAGHGPSQGEENHQALVQLVKIQGVAMRIRPPKQLGLERTK